jgi:hypothetical protein
MFKRYLSKIHQFSPFFYKKLTKYLVEFLAIATRFTCFWLFNRFVYVFSMLTLFLLPMYFHKIFSQFVTQLGENPSNFVVLFRDLPLILQIVFDFYLFLIGVTILCTVLLSIPFFKEKLIEKTGDPLILEKRGYLERFSSVRKAATLLIPVMAAIILLFPINQPPKTRRPRTLSDLIVGVGTTVIF